MTVGVHSGCCRYSVYSTCALYSQHGAEEATVHRWLCCRRQSTVLTAPSARHLLPACDTAHAATSPPCHYPRTWYTVAQLGDYPEGTRGDARYHVDYGGVLNSFCTNVHQGFTYVIWTKVLDLQVPLSSLAPRNTTLINRLDKSTILYTILY